MILEELKLKNFRVFDGEHSFHLSPRKKYGKKRPIILYGGLNGAGKTSILKGVRLALYGKQSLGPRTSQLEYEEYLKNSIHKKKDLVVKTSSAEVCLQFSYANMGSVSSYTIRRSWTTKGKKVIESLSVYENDDELTGLNPEQCQGFLNELIPIGVSDLFFFDGEKISELAEDSNGSSLGDSIKKLLGLDIIETLRTDLGIIQRNESKKVPHQNTQREIEKLECDLQLLEKLIEAELSRYEDARQSTQEADAILSKLDIELSSKGGAWAASRDNEIVNQTRLETEKSGLERSLIDLFSGSYPISLAEEFCKRTIEQLRLEREYRRNSDASAVIKDRLSSLISTLKATLSEPASKKALSAINLEFKDHLSPSNMPDPIHDVSDSLFSTIEEVINRSLKYERESASKLNSKLKAVTDNLENTKFNIARAPESDQIRPIVRKISEWQEKRAFSLMAEKKHADEYRRLLREALDLAKRLEKLTENVLKRDSENRTLNYVSSSRNLLADFSKEMTSRKIKDLENEFISSLHRLSRKEDHIYSAQISPTNFSVELFTQQGDPVNKNELSAGEKQIYAIAILEALARTSGRKLPIIIDTPLGRLDSAHREKLIENYFPYASHQVIILSTDTEIDKTYYRDFSKFISHAFKLDYSTSSGSTEVTEGYFWKTNN